MLRRYQNENKKRSENYLKCVTQKASRAERDITHKETKVVTSLLYFN